VNAALYWTIWIALALFAAGEAGKRALRSGRPVRPLAWFGWTAGLALGIVHTAMAFALRHEWSHEAAVESTARQAEAVYGLAWGGGLYVNYAFLGVWAWEAARWRQSPASVAAQPVWLVRSLQLFYFVIILNAAVIFAGGARRIAGALLVLCLLWIWRPGRA
jgi:hypothetical protein